jgi:hypothetical protein|tara:strand:+ start:60 stop:1139 length:1080 start_codon:yes stop_codon:yes gene_type:complete
MSISVIETKSSFLARCGYLRKTKQGLWTTGSVFSQGDTDAFIDGVPVGLGHIRSISMHDIPLTIDHTSLVNLIENMKRNEKIIEEYPTVFCQDCLSPFPDTINNNIEFNYNVCTFCGLTQFIGPKTPKKIKLQSCQKSHRQYNLIHIDGVISDIGSKFAYQFVGIRAIISAARFKLIEYYNLFRKLPYGGNAFAGACFFAAVCEFRNSRFCHSDLPAKLETIALFASGGAASTKKQVTNKRILTLVHRLVIHGLCTDDIPELKRMELFHNCTQKIILLNFASKPVIRLKDSGQGAIVVSGKTGDNNGLLVGDFVEKCNGICIAANMSLAAVIETIRKAKDYNKMVTLTIQRKSTKKRKR